MSIEYQAPTGLNGTYDPLLLQVDLSWTAAVDGIPMLYSTPGSYSYSIDPTADHIVATVIGGGGGGASGVGRDGNGDGGVGGGAGGGWITGTFAVSGLSSTEAVVVGAGGAGAASTHYTSGTGLPFNGSYGSAGGASSLGSTLLVANGGGVCTASIGIAPGGTTSHSGGTSVSAETGGNGGARQTGQSVVAAAPGASTTNAPAGGACGGSAAGSSSTTLSPYVNSGGAVTNGGAAGVGGAGALDATINAHVVGSGGSPGGAAPVPGVGGGGGGQGGAAMANDSLSTAGSATGGNGGAGGVPGGGGGSGGEANYSGFGNFNTGTMDLGSGGAGANGQVYIIQYWLHTQAPQYLIYRNGTLLAVTAPGATSYDDLSPVAGPNVYTVYASYDGVTQQSAASNPTTITISGGVAYASGKFSPANAFAPVMLINVKGIKPKIYPPVINPNMRSRR